MYSFPRRFIPVFLLMFSHLFVACGSGEHPADEYGAYYDADSEDDFEEPDEPGAFSDDEDADDDEWPQSAQRNASNDWATFEGRGYTLRYPEGWSVRETGEHRVLIESRQGQFQLTSMMVPDITKQQISAVVIKNCTGSYIDPTLFQWAGDGSLHASQELNGYTEGAGIMIQESGGGLSLMCGTISARSENYTQFAVDANQILATMRATEASGGMQESVSNTNNAKTDYRNAAMVTKSDPEEGSYTVQIPQGWSFTGGTGRVHVLETRKWFMTNSPDGDITVFFGDLDVPMFVEPNPYMGLQEGTWHRTQFSGDFWVKRPVTGLEFAQERVKTLFGNLENFKMDDQLDETRKEQQAAQQAGVQNAQYLTAGISTFTFTRNGEKMTGMYMAVVTRYPDSGSWGVILSLRALTPVPRTEETVALMQKMVVTPNPQWEAKQRAGAMQNQRVMTQYFEQTNKMINDAYRNRMAAQDASYAAYKSRSESSERIQRNFIDAIWEVQRVQDPQTGKNYEMRYGSMSYWIDNHENRVGTTTHDNPNPLYFRELLQIKD